MFHGRKLNAHINRLHERALQVVYKNFDSSFEITTKVRQLYNLTPTKSAKTNYWDIQS